MSLGQAIKELRLKKGMTQEELATKTDTKARTIQRIENDEVNPRAYTVQRIAEALEVDFESLNDTNGAKAESNFPSAVADPVKRRSYNYIFLYLGILLLGTALGITTGEVLARGLKMRGQTNEIVIISLIIWIGISFIACYFLSRKLTKH